MELEYVADGVNAESKLNTLQIDEFYHKMKKTVWKVKVSYTDASPIVYNGVSIVDGQYILTGYFDPKNATVYVSSGEVEYLETSLVKINKDTGMSLLKIVGETRYNFVKFACGPTFDAGPHLYAISYTRKASSPMFLMGHCAFPFLPYTGLCRMLSDLDSKEVYPSGLLDHCLLQAANLGCTSEYGSVVNVKKMGLGFLLGVAVRCLMQLGILWESLVFNTKGLT